MLKYFSSDEINAESYEITDGGEKIRDGSMNFEKLKIELERLQGKELIPMQRDRLRLWIKVILGEVNIVSRSLP